jgi:hypothetical protein
MDIRELSIGNWVQVKMVKWDYEDLDITPPMQVVKIEQNCVRLGFSPNDLEFEVFVEDLQPVPITYDIIKAIGFTPMDEDEEDDDLNCWELEDVCYIFSFSDCWRIRSYSDLAIVCDIKHVHELQNAFRLMKIDKQFTL